MSERADVRVDVAVIGCGTTGLALARLLELEGLTVALVDRGRLPIPFPRATHLDDETMRAFQTLGLHELEETFSLVGTYRHYDAKWRTVVAMDMNRGITEQGWQSDYMFHQPDFEAVLRGHAENYAGASTWFGWDLTALEDSGDEVVLSVREIATDQVSNITASYVVGADGANSRVRKFIGATQTDHHATHRSLITDIMPLVELGEGKGLPGRDSWIHAVAPNPLTALPTAAPRLRFELMLRPDDDSKEFERAEKAYEMIAPWLQPHEYRLLRSDVYEWRSLTADQWRVGRVLLAGDAAHTMPPHLGQGMCSGIRDATNLGWKLGRVVRGESAPALLDTYQSERRPHVVTFTTIAAEMANRIEILDAPEEEPEVFEAPVLRPPLGPGVRDIEEGRAGTLSAQPRTGEGELLDDLVGYRFSLIATPEATARTSPAALELLAALDVATVEAVPGPVGEWLNELGAAAAIVRPDRYLFGAVDEPEGVEALIARLRAALEPLPVPAEAAGVPR
ncbi:bifunctional 3-(3-hydroxy-phenyl)propionate/3-hydroxycinnamic acid hydroxylase [Herbiconiux sp. CPCC 203407]|uniref:Bifunctional 3-(3-hydroxy-phenyl)propionate/3-hydroxycinnamic acid hydroxylase n=1 Tax=Herbiconiux oxytropis TaxID=2970915 RepID=A0AA41XEU2_9MICO|nr:bifunctional 3-(3-hydroxy-phenyl)propionate/3-hydroxycinnamic acid hydroxylase [Herbiconiux oxytropis]MCS5720769.1 bifunctional 3-(3-hydroxy-phenyl)propionate/3-hydroxycinnamic acid hydroxylase [Herbiconiux oxytropis]MCS5724904.1 bifunctional 3-(3-hydroxy-phenyl)propionate/3-hydroxycinnamic acid hydroxylase [Herbiconiux oxytropis]